MAGFISGSLGFFYFRIKMTDNQTIILAIIVSSATYFVDQWESYFSSRLKLIVGFLTD